MTSVPDHKSRVGGNPVTQATRLRSCLYVLLGTVLLGPAIAGGCSEQPRAGKVTGTIPADLQAGEARFNTYCARCHGERAAGTNQGPPLVHKIYEPSHHGDGAFYRAAANGVRAHHWNFGAMPKTPGVTTEDVAHIIQYVRWLQRQAGIT